MNETARQAHPWKPRAIFIAQAVLAVAVLAFVFRDQHRRHEVAQAVRHASVAWLVAGIFCYGVVELLGGLRWHLLLRVQGFRLGWRKATSIFLMGLFLLTFTPGLIGGDALRVLLVIREAPERKADAVLVVAMDRLMGLISLTLMAAVVVLCRYRWLATSPATGGPRVCDAFDPRRRRGYGHSLSAGGAAAVAFEAGTASRHRGETARDR